MSREAKNIRRSARASRSLVFRQSHIPRRAAVPMPLEQHQGQVPCRYAATGRFDTGEHQGRPNGFCHAIQRIADLFHAKAH